MEKGKIQNYENNSCDDKFCYEVWLKKGTRWSEEEIYKNLKLSSNHNLNLTTVMPDGKLHIWDKKTGVQDIVEEFYKFRLPFVQTRIERKREELKDLILFYEGFVKFIEAVIAKKVVLKDLSEEDFETLLLDKYKIPSKFVERVMNAPLRTFTTNKIEDLRKKLESANDDYSYYSSTTAEEEYKKDLEELKKVIK
jgi:DNA gyrase/topoisomerase IV subunit A